MWNVRYLVAFAEPDDVRKVVLDDPEVVAVVLDVRRKQQRVAPADDALLAQVRRAPIDFQLQLVCLEYLWRSRKSGAELREERDVSMRVRLIVGQPGIRELFRPAGRRESDESSGFGIVPRLGACDGCNTHQD